MSSAPQICIVGLGPAGLGAALRLAASDLSRSTVCFEAGVSAPEKYCSILHASDCRRVEPCQMISGIGGCSVLSGGKVSEFPAGRGMNPFVGGEARLREYLAASLALFQQYVPLNEASAASSAVDEWSRRFDSAGFQFRYYAAHRYRQADLVRGYTRMVDDLRASDISIHLNTQVTRIVPEDRRFAVTTRSASEVHTRYFETVFIAAGRLSSRLLVPLNDTLALHGETRPLDVGVRLEFPTELWPDIDTCHKDLKLHFGAARTFCVCKDGWVAPYRVNGVFLTEGHSDPSTRTGLTNLAVTLRIPPSVVTSTELFALFREEQKGHWNSGPIRQSLLNFLNQSSSETLPPNASISFFRPGDVNRCFPAAVSQDLREAVHYFVSRLLPADSWSQIAVFGPEMDQYWAAYPLSFGFASTVPGLFILGDASGHFRGILQAFCSGLTCADIVLERWDG